MASEDRPIGIPRDLPPEQLEQWANGLVAFLASDEIPQQFREWAQQQADAVDAHMASGAAIDEAPDPEDEIFDPDEDEDADLDDENEDERPIASPRRQRAMPGKTRAARRRAVAGSRGGTLRIPAESGRLLAGVVIGVAVLVAVLGIRNLMADSSAEPQLPATADAPLFDEARAEELEVLLNQDPNNQDALFELGEMNFQAARYEDMIPWFTKLVELDPANKHALTDLGTAHYNLGQPAEAKIWWEKVLAVDPNDVQAHYNLGFMYANAEPRDLAAAVREWETVLTLDPESQLAQTARVHVEGLRAELAAASGAGSTPAAGTPAVVTPTPAGP